MMISVTLFFFPKLPLKNYWADLSNFSRHTERLGYLIITYKLNFVHISFMENDFE